LGGLGLAGLGNSPILILKEGHERETGKDALRKNILAARALTEAVRTTLGPKGMDKMLVDNIGDVVITNDGATILWEMDVEHPVAKMIVEVARTQDDEVGDGTTTAVVIAGELLKSAEGLLEQGVHPTVIVQGYKEAGARALKILDEIAVTISKEDRKMLNRIAQTAMTGKGIEVFKEKLSEICLDAAIAIAENGKVDVEERVKIIKTTGGSMGDTDLKYGIVLDKERLNPEMPKRVEDAKIALLDGTLELKKLSTDAKVKITDAEGLKSIRDGEDKVLAEQVEALAKIGANVIFCQKGIGLPAQHHLTKHGILGVRRASDEEMKMLSLATGAKIHGDIFEMTEQDLGHADLVEERKVAKEHMIFVEGCKNPKAVSIIIRGATEHILDNIERAMNDALCAVGDVLESERIVPGGGAIEMELAGRIKQYASSLTGRDQLAVEAFADAIEAVPMTLAENAGIDPIDMLVTLRSKHEAGLMNYGIGMTNGEGVDMMEVGVVEPLKVKTQALKSAVEAATVVLRVDDVVAAKRGEMTPSLGQSPHDYTSF
jgi:thermosome